LLSKVSILLSILLLIGRFFKLIPTCAKLRPDVNIRAFLRFAGFLEVAVDFNPGGLKQKRFRDMDVRDRFSFSPFHANIEID
jgi:hypothetical protein